MVNTVALIGVIVSLISVILFIFNGVYFQQIYNTTRNPPQGILGALAANTNNRAYAFMIINYVFAGLMALALLYFIFAAFRTPKVEVETTDTTAVVAPVPTPYGYAPRGQALSYPNAGCAQQMPIQYPTGCAQQRVAPVSYYPQLIVTEVGK